MYFFNKIIHRFYVPFINYTKISNKKIILQVHINSNILRALRNKDNIKNNNCNNCSYNVKALLNKSLNNHNYERHIKFKSMKLK